MLMMGGFMKYPKMLIVAAFLLLSSCVQTPNVSPQNPIGTTRGVKTGLSLPFPVGSTWILTGGPHRLSSNQSIWDSIDVQDRGRFDPNERGANVNAAGNGTLTRLNDIGWGNCGATINHGNGLQTVYYHLDVTRANGAISRGGPHLHFALRREATASVGAPLPIQDYEIGAWQPVNGSGEYSGSLRNISSGSTVPQWSNFYNDGTNAGETSQCPSTYPAPPENRAPGGTEANPTIVTTQDVTLTWGCVNGATSVGMYVRKVGDPNLTVDEDYVQGSSYSVAANRLQVGATYRWNMISFNGTNYDGNQFSSVQFFRYDGVPPPPPPTWTVAPTSMTFTGIVGVKPAPQSFTIQNIGGAGTFASFSSDDAWLSATGFSTTVAAGSSTTGNALMVLPCSTPGITNGTLRFVTGSSTATISVTRVCNGVPIWTPSVSSLTLPAGTVGGTTSSNTFSLQNTGTASGTYTLTASSPFTISPATGTLANGSSTPITVTAPACTAVGTLTSSISIAGSTNTVSVSRVCTVATAPVPTGFALTVSSNGRIFASWNESPRADQYEFAGTFDTNTPLGFSSGVNARGSGTSGAVLVWGSTPEDPTKQGKPICVQIRAKNAGGSSNYASPVCTTYKYYTGVSLKSSSPVVTISIP
jgi:hypothetical protein